MGVKAVAGEIIQTDNKEIFAKIGTCDVSHVYALFVFSFMISGFIWKNIYYWSISFNNF